MEFEKLFHEALNGKLVPKKSYSNTELAILIKNNLIDSLKGIRGFQKELVLENLLNIGVQSIKPNILNKLLKNISIDYIEFVDSAYWFSNFELFKQIFSHLRSYWPVLLINYGLVSSNLECIEEAINLSREYDESRELNIESYIEFSEKLCKPSYIEKLLWFGIPIETILDCFIITNKDSLYDENFYSYFLNKYRRIITKDWVYIYEFYDEINNEDDDEIVNYKKIKDE